MSEIIAADQVQAWTKEHMQKAVEHMEFELRALRTGKATPALVENIQVEAYGSMMRLKDVAGISIPEPRLIVIQPWDKSLLSVIEKTIRSNPIGINPLNDGTVLRLPIPELTEERRKKLGKEVKEFAEVARVTTRNVRRDANESIKKAQKASTLSEDQAKDELDKIQKLTDQTIAKIDELAAAKEKDLMAL